MTLRTMRRRKRPQRSRVLLKIGGLLTLTLLVCIMLSLLVLGLGSTAVYAAVSGDLPTFDTLRTNITQGEPSKIYALGEDREGDGQRDWVLIDEVADPLGPQRRWVPLEEMPSAIVEATRAIENRRFGESLETDEPSRAWFSTGPSIAQQIAENQLPRSTTGYERQVELFLLRQGIEQTYTPAEILEWYLNTSFYGHLAYGIEAAVQVYFDKPLAQLTLAEATLLAALPRAPERNPIDALDTAKHQQEWVLEAMHQAQLIDQATQVAAQFTPLEIAADDSTHGGAIAPHYTQQVRRELERRFGAEQLLRGGLEVYTALDLRWQSQADCVARAHLAQLAGDSGTGLAADEVSRCAALAFLSPSSVSFDSRDRRVGQAAVIMLEPHTGHLKALVGNLNDPDEASFNIATASLRQPGAILKPFTYLTAFAQGYTPATMVLDVETDFGTAYNGVAYTPQNDDLQFHGPLSIRQALGNNYNVPAVQVMSWVGVDNVVRTAQKMGVTTLDPSLNSYTLALTLGGGEVNLSDLVYAFGTLANGGTMMGQPAPLTAARPLDPVTILRVVDRTGAELHRYAQPEQREVLTPPLAYLLNDILSDNRARCRQFGCPNRLKLPDGRPAAVQTGTTNDFRDAWTIGYTPQLVVGVWVGNRDNTPMAEVTGLEGAAPIWQALMGWALQGEPIETWVQPAGIVEYTVCTPSGLLSNGLCPTTNEIFIEGTEPELYDNMYRAVQINRETGRLATVSTPAELVETEVYAVYPEAAAAWVRDNQIPQPPTEYDTISALEPRTGQVAIHSPQPFAPINGGVEIVGTTQIDNFAHYRVAYFAGLTPTSLQILTDTVTTAATDEVLASWDVGHLNGLYTLLLTVVRRDGTFEEASVPVTVDNVPPTAALLPLAAEIPLSAIIVKLQAEANDDIALARVEFYLDDSRIPFAVSEDEPYTMRWRIPRRGCYRFRAIAVDGAGNETESTAVRTCIVE